MKAICRKDPRRGRLVRALLGVLCAGALLIGCGADCEDVTPTADVSVGDTFPASDVDGVAGEDGGAVAEPSVPTCTRCHVLPDLQQPSVGEGLSPGLWMAVAGEGLTRWDPSTPLDGDVHFEIVWPRRGRHGDEACASCHPVQPGGIGHGVVQYGDAARDAAHATGGVGCAGACHSWIPGNMVAAAPFAPLPVGEDGGRIGRTVPARPAALAEADNGHAALWREGFNAGVPRADLRVDAIAPGCAGCHGVTRDVHGEIPHCLTCHDFGGKSGDGHADHVAAIIARQGTNDPDTPDRSPCLYCHGFNDPDDDEPDQVFRAACYNCHLSGHQPLAPEGGAHFWL